MSQNQGPVGLNSNDMVFGSSESQSSKGLEKRDLPPSIILEDEHRKVDLDVEDSDLLYTFQPAVRSFLPVMVVTAIFIVLVINMGGELVSALHWLHGKNQALGVTEKNVLLWRWLVVLTVVLLVYLWVEIGRANSKLFVFKDHIEIHKGIVARNRTTLSYSHIRAVDTKQKVLERLLGLGTLSIGSSATSGHEIMIGRLRKPLFIRKIIVDKLPT